MHAPFARIHIFQPQPRNNPAWNPGDALNVVLLHITALHVLHKENIFVACSGNQKVEEGLQNLITCDGIKAKISCGEALVMSLGVVWLWGCSLAGYSEQAGEDIHAKKGLSRFLIFFMICKIRTFNLLWFRVVLILHHCVKILNFQGFLLIRVCCTF